KRSTDRILTTHVGSLIRPAALRAFLSAKEAGGPFDHAAYAKCLKQSVAEVVRKQADIGIDVISDGEFGKAISLGAIRAVSSRRLRTAAVRRRQSLHPRRRPDAVCRVLCRARFARQGRNRDGFGRGGADHLYRAG